MFAWKHLLLINCKTVSNIIVIYFQDGVEAKVQAVVTGRRVVDVAFLASQLFCSCCNSPIQLCDITSETRRGLASVFSVACNSCQFVSMVSTSRRHRGPKGPYDVNTKLALGNALIVTINQTKLLFIDVCSYSITESAVGCLFSFIKITISLVIIRLI